MNKHPHKNLEAWKKAMDIVVDIYKLTSSFPKSEVYGLTSQLRRASVSVPSNIAEGSVGRSEKSFSNYLTIALGSLTEVDTQLELANRIGYVNNEDFIEMSNRLDTCKGLIYGLRRSILNKL